MNSEEKNQFDAIYALQQMTSNGMNRRQNAEWKMTISLWTVLSIFIGTVLTGRISILHSQNILIFTIISISIICVLYILNLIGVWKYQMYQLSLTSDYGQQLFMMSEAIRSENTEARYVNVVKYHRIKWYLILRIGITLILLISVVLSVSIAVGDI